MRALNRSGISGAALVYFALCIPFAYLCVAKGVPVFRHDWIWPETSQQGLAIVSNALSGWSNAGLGAPRPYNNDYIIAPLLLPLWLLLPGVGSLFFFAAALSFAIARESFELATALGCRRLGAISIAAFAVFNPWIYTELVAGHLYMLLSYAAMIAITRLLYLPGATTRAIWFWVAITVAQMQFFVIVTVQLLLSRKVPRRQSIVFLSLLWSPIAIGMLLERNALLDTPYYLSWQVLQSIPLQKAALLSGYFAGYDLLATEPARIAISLIVICVLIASASMFQRKAAYRTIGVTASVGAVAGILLASGAIGPIGPVYAAAALSFTATGLYRELYDIIGLVAICYIVLLAKPVARWPKDIALCLGAFTLIGCWFASPPSKYWVASATVPEMDHGLRSNARFALFPAFQPFSFMGNGSGADPEAYARFGNSAPLNAYTAAPPEIKALGRYMLFGEAKDLEALGVDYAVVRGALRSTDDVVGDSKYDGPLRLLDGAPTSEIRYHRLHPMPELALWALAPMTDKPMDLGTGKIFFNDAPSGALRGKSAPAIHIFHARSQEVGFTTSWVDARLAFRRFPMAAQNLGGIFTESGTLAELPRSGYLLANVRGKLFDASGALLATGNGADYYWIPIKGRSMVRCDGACFLVGMTDSSPCQRSRSNTLLRALDFSSPLPFLMVARIAESHAHLLTATTTYNTHWIAVGRGVGPHVRVDGAINGWILKQVSGPVVILEWVAALQAMASVIVILSLVGCLVLTPFFGSYLRCKGRA